MDAVKYLLQQEKETETITKSHFSFLWLAREIIERQKQDKDTIIVTTGERRMGKSNWNMKVLQAFLRAKKADDGKPLKWSWKKNFPLTREQAIENTEDIPDRSFVFYDEGGDIAYSADTLNAMNKRLIKFMAKSGKKKLLTLIALPDIFMLDKKILNMAIFLVAVPYRYRSYCSFAFMYGRNPNPFVQDKFGLEYIKRLFASRKAPMATRMPTLTGKINANYGGKKVEIPYPKDLFKFLKTLPTFLHHHRFTAVSKAFEARYIKNVKNPQMYMSDTFGFVKNTLYKRLSEQYETILYNLYYKQGLNYSQIERLHLNKLGVRLANAPAIKKQIENLTEKFGYAETRKKKTMPVVSATFQKELPGTLENNENAG